VAYDVAIHGHYAYVAQWADGIRIVDIADPAMPRVVRDFGAGHNTVGVTTDEGVLYVANWAGSWDTYDLAEPENPVLRSRQLTDGNSVQRSVVHGERAYVVTTGRFCIFDVSTRTNPVELSCVLPKQESPQGGFGVDIAIRENIAFFAYGGGRVPLFDVSNPSAPSQLRTATNAYGWGVTLVDDYLYQSSSGAGLHVFDVSNLANPVHVMQIPTGGFSYRTVANGDRLFLPNGTRGLRIYDISNRTNLVPLVDFSDANWVVSLTVNGDYVYAGNNNTGMTIFRFTEFPLLNIAKANSGRVIVSWTPAPGFVLQQSESLDGAGFWTDVDNLTTNRAEFPAAQEKKYFRLHKPR
jgi:hypothetical protein